MTEDDHDPERLSFAEYLRECYQEARETHDAPRRMEPDEPAIERLTRERKLLWAQLHKAQDDGEARAYAEFLAWFPGPIGWKPDTWAIGKRLKMILFPNRFVWSREKRRAARWETERDFRVTYPDPRFPRLNFMSLSQKIDAELEAARMPESRSASAWQMVEIIQELHDTEGLDVAAIAEFLDEHPDHIGYALRLRTGRNSADGSTRWDSGRDSGGGGSFDGGGFGGCGGGGDGGSG
ncbi:hypothetical protein [Nocardia sp. NPDC003345]